eukprot:TCALIF_01685-PA protein Name:"Protein of unknown function" AED:0.45 eAED:0.45 QI:0/0.66/0.5/0.75/0.66/0.5/4/148/215
MFLLISLGFVCCSSAVDTSCFQTPDLIAAKHKLCPGNKFDIYNISISTLFNRANGRHPLFRGETVEVCIAGKANGISAPVKFLQNSVHGKLNILVDIFSPFCDITLDGCANLTPQCQPEVAILPDQEFCFCSKLQVPIVAPNVNVMTFWKILAADSLAEVNQCETEFSVDRLFRNKGKETLVCLEIPTMVRGSRPKGLDRQTIINKVLAQKGTSN